MATATKARVAYVRMIDINFNATERAVAIGDVLYTYDFRSASGSMAYGDAWARALIKAHTVTAIAPKGDRLAFNTIGRPEYESVHARSYFESADAAKAGLDRKRAETIAGLQHEIAAIYAIERADVQAYLTGTVRNA